MKGSRIIIRREYQCQRGETTSRTACGESRAEDTARETSIDRGYHRNRILGESEGNWSNLSLSLTSIHPQHMLENEAHSTNKQRRGLPSELLADVRPVHETCNAVHYRLTPTIIHQIFIQYPAVKRYSHTKSLTLASSSLHSLFTVLLSCPSSFSCLPSPLLPSLPSRTSISSLLLIFWPGLFS